MKVLANISPAGPAPPFRVVMRVRAAGLDAGQVRGLVAQAAEQVRRGAPGYVVTSCGIVDGLATAGEEVTASGAWLPRYAGNLEVISAAAVATG